MKVVHLADGRTAVVKRGAGPGAARAEAAGLRWLGSSGDVPTPEVYACDEDELLTEYVPPGQPSVAAAQQLGRGLAALHLRGAPAHGAPPPGGPADAWIGLAPMRNATHASWPEFYRTERVEPYVRLAVDGGSLSAEQARVVARACERLPDVCGPPEPPARLHGDLWSGNVHWAAVGAVGREKHCAWLIDPAAHGGHRETDLAMLQLFGLPLLDVVLQAYAEAAADAGSPLADGWRERVGLHQLFPLLVHTVLFGGGGPPANGGVAGGGGYAQQAVAAARSTLSLA